MEQATEELTAEIIPTDTNTPSASLTSDQKYCDDDGNEVKCNHHATMPQSSPNNPMISTETTFVMDDTPELPITTTEEINYCSPKDSNIATSNTSTITNRSTGESSFANTIDSYPNNNDERNDTLTTTYAAAAAGDDDSKITSQSNKM